MSLFGKPIAFSETPLDLVPPMPPDPAPRDDGTPRYGRWFVVATSPGFVATIKGSDKLVKYDIDREWIEAQCAEYERFQGLFGYCVPVRMNHQPFGLRFGDVVEARYWYDPRETIGVDSEGNAIPYPEQNRHKMIVAVYLADMLDPEVRLATGALKYVSPGFRSVTRSDGENFPMVLGELSFTDAPQIKDMVPGNHALSEGGDAATPTEEEANMEEILKQILERLTALEAAQTPVAAAEDPAEEPAEEIVEEIEAGEADPDAAAKVQVEAGEQVELSESEQKLMERVKALEAKGKANEEKLRRAEFDTAYPTGAVVELSEGLRDDLYALYSGNQKAFGNFAKAAKRPEKPAAKPEPPAKIQWGATLGESGEASKVQTTIGEVTSLSEIEVAVLKEFPDKTEAERAKLVLKRHTAMLRKKGE